MDEASVAQEFMKRRVRPCGNSDSLMSLAACVSGVTSMRRLASYAVCVLMITAVVALGVYLYSVAEDKQTTPRLVFQAATGSPFAVGPMAQKLLIADKDGDGNPDIVLTCGGTTRGKPD